MLVLFENLAVNSRGRAEAINTFDTCLSQVCLCGG